MESATVGLQYTVDNKVLQARYCVLKKQAEVMPDLFRWPCKIIGSGRDLTTIRTQTARTWLETAFEESSAPKQR